MDPFGPLKSHYELNHIGGSVSISKIGPNFLKKYNYNNLKKYIKNRIMYQLKINLIITILSFEQS